MTCRYSESDWLDLLYNSVRNAPGGVAAAAAFLAQRRGRTIHKESLRSKLRGLDGETVSMEVAQLLGEWLTEMGRPDALDWLKAFAAQFSLVCEQIDAAPAGGWPCEVTAIKDKLLALAMKGGSLTQVALAAVADDDISEADADAIERHAMEEARLLFRLSRNARRAARKKGAAK